MSAYAHGLFYTLYDPSPEQSALADAAMDKALALQPDLPEVHLAHALVLYRVHEDFEQARVQLAIARRGLPNDSEAIALEAYIDRRAGNWDKAIQELNDAITRDPHNSVFIEELALTLFSPRSLRSQPRWQTIGARSICD